MLTRVAVNAVAIWIAAFLIDGISVSGPDGKSSLVTTIVSILVIGAIFGLVNAIVRPLVKLLTLPLLFLTLGLFTFVLNALMLQLTSWLTGFTPLGFHIETFFWDAILGAILISLVSMVANVVLPDRD